MLPLLISQAIALSYIDDPYLWDCGVGAIWECTFLYQ
jgi:hypothetical protein